MIKLKFSIKAVLLRICAVVLLLAVTGALALSVFFGRRTPANPVPEGTGNQITESPVPVNPYTAEDFTMKDGYLTCLSGESKLGVDVSHFQGTINWKKAAKAGISFAIIRIGGRGYGEEGRLYADTKAKKNYTGAKKAGLQVGVYFFSQATTPEEAREEAAYALDLIKDWELDLPVVFDWEKVGEDGRTVGITTKELIPITKAFCEEITLAGYEAMIYFNPNQSQNIAYLDALQEYRFWLALYSEEMSFPYKVDFWQYTNKGKVPGFSKNVDLNLMLTYS